MRRANSARLLLVASLLFMLCAFVALLALMPSYAIVQAGSNALGDGSSGSLSDADQAARDDIFRAQLMLRDLRPVASATSSALSLFDIVLRERPKGVLVRSLNYERGDPGTIIVQGTAPSREEINAYRAALAKDPAFKSASVPLQNLTGSGDGHFTLTLTGAF